MGWIKKLRKNCSCKNIKSSYSTIYRQYHEKTVTKKSDEDDSNSNANASIKHQMQSMTLAMENMQLKIENFNLKEKELKRKINKLQNQVKKSMKFSRPEVNNNNNEKNNTYLDTMIKENSYEKRIKELEEKIIRLENSNNTPRAIEDCEEMNKEEKKDIYYVIIKNASDDIQRLFINSLDMKVEDLIKQYSEIMNINENSVRLFRKGKYLYPDDILSNCDIKAGSSLECY